MKRKKLMFFIIFVILFFILIMCYNFFIDGRIKEFYYNILKEVVGEPISVDGTINNNFFGINKDGTSATKTTKGINNAIEYASENNIEYIKLEKGVYLINGIVDNKNSKNRLKGIILKSNIKFDLNSSQLKHIDNDREMYTVISCYDIENVEIFNGTIIGDMKNHNYNNMNSTHEWGYGIDIKAGENVSIHNLEIYNMTGDGIAISNLPDYATKSNKTRNSENIEIYNCNIHDNRRQGISVISADNITIKNNEIYDMEGTAPRSCIDLETNPDLEQKIDHVFIFENKLYNMNTYNKMTIQTYNYVYNVKIENNEIHGRINIDKTYDTIEISNNFIKDGFIASNIKLGLEEKIIIKNNIIDNSYLSLNNTSYIIFKGNLLYDSSMEVNNSTMAVYDNIANERNSTKMYAILYRVSGENKNKFNIYSNNNTFLGNYTNGEYIIEQNKPYIIMNKQEEELKIFLNSIGEEY